MDKKIIALLISYFRPYGLWRAIDSLKHTAPSVDIIATLEPEDFEAHKICKDANVRYVIVKESFQGPAYAWNTGFAEVPDYDIYVMATDDLYYMYGWLEECMKYIDQYGLVGFNGNSINDYKVKYKRIVFNTDWAEHYMMTREFIIKYNGGVFAVPYYDGWFVDMESCGRARNAGQFIKLQGANVKHDWHGAANGGHKAKLKPIFLDRQARGFPDDFPPIITK